MSLWPWVICLIKTPKAEEAFTALTKLEKAAFCGNSSELRGSFCHLNPALQGGPFPFPEL